MGYLEWLKSQGVQSISENAVGLNNKETVSEYIFASYEEAKKFMNKYLLDNQSVSVTFNNSIKLNLEAQAPLKKQYEISSMAQELFDNKEFGDVEVEPKVSNKRYYFHFENEVLANKASA